MPPAEEVTPVVTCAKCLRTKATTTDLERWRKEVEQITRLGGDPLKHNPYWAFVLCWTKDDAQCHCKPLSESRWGGERA